MLGFNNSNGLVKNSGWDIQLPKTGYIREAGKCLVMLATIASKPFVIVLLDSVGKYTRLGDAQRVRHWLETGEALAPTARRRRVEAGEGEDRRVQGDRGAKNAATASRRTTRRTGSLTAGSGDAPRLHRARRRRGRAARRNARAAVVDAAGERAVGHVAPVLLEAAPSRARASWR